jgi:hypothetical protein
MSKSEWNAIVQNLERQDIHRMLRSGMAEEMALEVRNLCLEYIAADTEKRRFMKSAITQQASPVVLHFTSRMATLAMQRGDKEAIDLGLAAFDLSNIMLIDPRDAFGPIGRLAFAAEQCDVDLLDRATVIIGGISPQLMQVFTGPKPAQVERDAEGNLCFGTPGQ